MGSRRIRMLAMGAIALLAAVVAAPAQATFPGENGKIALTRIVPPRYDWTIFSISPTGADETMLSDITTTEGNRSPVWSPDGTEIAFEGAANTGTRGNKVDVMDAAGGSRTTITSGYAPAWSPDGTKLAYTNTAGGSTYYLFTINRDGTDRRVLTTMHHLSGVWEQGGKNWSPDGTKIAFDDRDLYISVINADGTGEQRITSIYGESPSWSPDGTRIAFGGYLPDGSGFPDEIYTMNPDGTGLTRLTNNTVLDHSPAWSPDGTRIAFTSMRTGSVQIHSMDPDGSDVRQVTTSSALNSDWQPIPVNSYPRPKGATPLQVSLVPAYNTCATPDRSHGPPLAFGSCSAPASTSSLTVGTADANGKPSKSNSFARFTTIAGSPGTPADEADVQLDAAVTDVYERATLADYTGNLAVSAPVRITDKLSTPHPGGPGAGTVSDAPLSFSLPCVATADTTAGASCALITTYDAVVPGAVTEGRRSIWALGQVEVRDSDGAPFMRQGVFIP
jgi:dipeptidyl aminopeptidase/acylaminoacyl peptidase